MWKCKVFHFGLMSWVLVAPFLSEALAQAYPAKPIRVIDPYPPGGGTDIVARMLAPKFQQSLGQPWVVENRPGAQGIIGTEIAAKAPPDGYTLLMFVSSYTIHPSLYKNLPYDLTKTFAPITQTSAVAIVLAVHPSVPAKTVKELIALAKGRRGALNFSSGGAGAITHMPAELFKSMARVSITHIPYKGAAPAVVAAVGGEVDLTFAPMPTAKPHLQSGRLRPLGVSTLKRVTAMPEVPTIAEAGLPGYEVNNAYGVLAPAGTPRTIIDKLHQEIVRTLKLPDIQKLFFEMGAEPVGSTPEQFAEHIRNDIAKWAKVVKSTGMELQTW